MNRRRESKLKGNYWGGIECFIDENQEYECVFFRSINRHEQKIECGRNFKKRGRVDWFKKKNGG